MQFSDLVALDFHHLNAGHQRPPAMWVMRIQSMKDSFFAGDGKYGWRQTLWSALLRGAHLPAPWLLNLGNAQTIEPKEPTVWAEVIFPSANNMYSFFTTERAGTRPLAETRREQRNDNVVE